MVVAKLFKNLLWALLNLYRCQSRGPYLACLALLSFVAVQNLRSQRKQSVLILQLIALVRDRLQINEPAGQCLRPTGCFVRQQYFGGHPAIGKLNEIRKAVRN